MKRLALVFALFAAGSVASIGLASPPSGGGPGGGTTGTTREHGHAPSSKCHPVILKGTVSGASLAVAVSKADPHAQNLKGTTVTFKVDGPVSVKAIACSGTSAAGSTAATMTLRQLKSEARPPQSK